jgi:hypothetical protein
LALALLAPAGLPARGDGIPVETVEVPEEVVHTPMDFGGTVMDWVHETCASMGDQIDYMNEDHYKRSCYFQADLVFLRRKLTNTNFPATSVGVRGPIVASLQDLHFKQEAGLQLLAGYRCSPWWSVELSYLGHPEWFDDVVVQDPQSRLFGVLNRFGTVQQPLFPAPPFPPTFGIGNNTRVQTADYRTRLHNAELNAIRDIIDLPLWGDEGSGMRLRFGAIVGLRYLRMKEKFSLRTRGNRAPGLPDDPGASADYVIDLKDDAFGGQFGARLAVCVFRSFTLSVDGKLAIMGLGAEQNSVALFTFNQPFQIAIPLFSTAGTLVTSYLGELSMHASWDITKHITLRAGYQLWWLQNRGLAPDQVDANATQQGFLRPLINIRGTSPFYGPNAGLEIKF